MNSLWDIRIFLDLVPKESPCIISNDTDNFSKDASDSERVLEHDVGFYDSSRYIF